jgi:Spy/CpxP family protein refolding chaperone
MKKLLFLSFIFAIIATTTNAQVASTAAAPQQPKQQVDPATMLSQMKERIKPQMIEKTGLTEAQVDKVIELNFEMRMAMAAFKDLSEADRAAKVAELKADKEKKMNALLTPEQIKAVAAFYEDMGKNAQNAQRKVAN